MNAKAVIAQIRGRSLLDHSILRFMQVAIVLIGALFWLEARLSGEAFSADVFGEFALRFQAEVWASCMMAFSAIIWIGLRRPVLHWMVAFGALGQMLQYLALGYSAIATGGEVVIGLHCTFFFAPIFAWLCWEAVFD